MGVMCLWCWGDIVIFGVFGVVTGVDIAVGLFCGDVS